MAILLIGSEHDPHISEVGFWLKRMGHSALAFDPRKWGSLLSAQSLSGQDEAIQIERSCLGRDEVSGVWVRFKPQRLTERQNTEDANVTRFVEAEWNAVIRGMYHFWSGASWINPIYGGGGSKLEQIYLARECGLDVPETLVTNDPDAVRELIGRCGKVVYKSLTTTDFSEAHWIWTTLLDESRIEQYADNICRAPGIFQEFVPKVYELRVTIVGDKIFSVKIVTPSEGPGVIDWRLSEPANNVELATISGGVAEALLRYNQMNGLVFAAHDLIVSPEGRTVFLECNRSGQYHWLEERLGLGISEAIATHLSETVSH